jgi:magnesium transporter
MAMDNNNSDRRNTWDIIASLLESNHPVELERYLASLTPAETARAVSRLNEEQREILFGLLSPGEAASVISDLPDSQAADVIHNLDPVEAAPIVESLPSHERADLLGDIPYQNASAILDLMSPQNADQARKLMAYPDNTAGGLMTADFVAFPDNMNVRQVVDELRNHRDRFARFNVQYVYIVRPDSVLAGVLRLRDLLLAPAEQSIRELLRRDLVAVQAGETLDNLRTLFLEQKFIGLPVVDHPGGRLIGVIARDTVLEAVGEHEQRLLMKMAGILGGDEYRSMPIHRRIGKRLSWLSLNIFLNVAAASVIAWHQDTIAAAVVLAVFLPIISDMSGCAGTQAVAVSIRELTLGLIRPGEVGRVLAKEISVGICNGIILGILLAAVAMLWKGNPYLGLVAGGALALNTAFAACLGGVLPLILRQLKVDPALAASPILTTVTDMCGFFFVLSFANMVLPRLAA